MESGAETGRSDRPEEGSYGVVSPVLTAYLVKATRSSSGVLLLPQG